MRTTYYYAAFLGAKQKKRLKENDIGVSATRFQPFLAAEPGTFKNGGRKNLKLHGGLPSPKRLRGNHFKKGQKEKTKIPLKTGYLSNGQRPSRGILRGQGGTKSLRWSGSNQTIKS